MDLETTHVILVVALGLFLLAITTLSVILWRSPQTVVQPVLVRLDALLLLVGNISDRQDDLVRRVAQLEARDATTPKVSAPGGR